MLVARRKYRAMVLQRSMLMGRQWLGNPYIDHRKPGALCLYIDDTVSCS